MTALAGSGVAAWLRLAAAAQSPFLYNVREALAGNLAAEATIEEFLDWFEGVEEWQVKAVLEHVARDLRAKVAHAHSVG